MITKRFDANPQLATLAGTEVIPATSVAAGTATGGDPVAAGTDIKIPVLQLLGLQVHSVAVVAGAATIDCGNGLHRNHTLVLGENATLSLSNLAPAGYATEGELRIAQDSVGNWRLALPPYFKPVGGSDTAIAMTANAVTVISYKSLNDGATFEYAMQESA